jgi:transposase
LAGDWRWLDQRIDGLSGEIEALARLDQACLRLKPCKAVCGR